MNEVVLGRAIASARKSAGLTQQQLCAKTDLSYSTLAKIERGAIKSPSVFTVAAIASATGSSVESLVGVASGVQLPAQKKTSKSGISFVYFDVNGVLVRFFQRAFTQLSLETGVSSDMIESTFWHYNDVVCRGEMTISEFNEALALRLGIAEIDWAKYYLESVDPIDEARELLKWLSTEFRIGLLSNIMPGLLDEMIKREILPNIPYDMIIDSSKVGAIKPENKIFEIAAEKAGVATQELLLIDDERANVMAAERLGWHVLWFDDFRPQESIERIKKIMEL